MKVLSLREPWATLIKDGVKRVETRSWKTKYRGELYIHASLTKIPNDWKKNKQLMDLISNKNLSFGKIICKCTLKDCIYMTREYVEQMKQNNSIEYLCGEYKEGRYAWILENIEIISKPIDAKGKLNIWTYNELKNSNEN